jgi:hypothetical protein
MNSKLTVAIIFALTGALLLSAPAGADKLICISKEELRGQETVQSCVLRGEKFAIIDEYGAVRILSKEEIDLMKKVNPKALEMPAYGIMYEKEAPPLPKLPPLAVPKAHQ